MFQPFVIAGGYNIIESLRNDGYDVFDDVIDHSYDNERDGLVRTNKIKDELTRLSRISDKQWSNILYDIFPRLVHNHEHLKGQFLKFNKFHSPKYKDNILTYNEYCHV